MGNCIRHESPMQWGGDNWSSAAGDEEEEELAYGLNMAKSLESQSPAAVEMVKVRITKRQLEELLGKVDVKELSVHQAVTQLLSAAAVSHHRTWRPALQSIPETN
ncbi:hypothetical protein CDL15_Pgr007313 [Punica granatum]|nr:hypothetical protein CDL15_Pgr007313 [Punica granatum]PKI67698.1 hypothetical protein CRG98_011911 [Punica granatum]